MTTLKFFQSDFPYTLFPLETNRFIIEHATETINAHIYDLILTQKTASFLPQTHVYASKHGYHLRRTMKLDPIAEYFIYDLVYRNRTSFRRSFKEERNCFGYRFENGEAISAASSYRDFRTAIFEARKKYKYVAKFDISSYFNSIYHHDLVTWFKSEGNRSEADAEALGLFLRLINSGRSVDCLPQGLMPTKILGNHFLKFIDNSNRLRSELLLRYMDDVFLFSDDENKLVTDFILIQRLLGEKGLSINPSKTNMGETPILDIKTNVDVIRAQLIKQKTIFFLISGSPEEFEVEEQQQLSQEQTEYLLNLLRNPEIEEYDAELVLTLMRERSDDVLEHLTQIIRRFPNLSRNIHKYCSYVEDINSLAKIVFTVANEENQLTEYQLFWIAKIVEDYLRGLDISGQIFIRLFEHQNATPISKAKILEIPEHKFGMPELREEHIRTGTSDWLSWSSAVGSRSDEKSKRNHLLGYYANSSHINRLIAECIANNNGAI